MKLMLLYGRPMLSRMLSSSACGISAANGRFDQVAEPRGLLDARSRFGAHVQNELAAIGVGKEVLTEPGNQEKCAKADAEKHRNENQPAIDKRGEQELVADADAFEAALERRAETSRTDCVIGRLPCCFARSRYMASVGTSVRDRT